MNEFSPVTSRKGNDLSRYDVQKPHDQYQYITPPINGTLTKSSVTVTIVDRNTRKPLEWNGKHNLMSMREFID